MAKIYGQIESLRKIRSELDKHNIKNIDSIGDIHDFTKNYSSYKDKLYEVSKAEFERELVELKNDIRINKVQIKKTKERLLNQITKEINQKKQQVNILHNKKNVFFLERIINKIQLKRFSKRIKYLTENTDAIIRRTNSGYLKKLEKNKDNIKQKTHNKEYEIKNIFTLKVAQLEKTHKVLQQIYPLIAGAIGENKVVNEIKKLPDNYILINDFQLKFNPPVFNRKENDRIFSIQIDHLLICKAGIFILETKNWSKKSVESLDLRSPIEQVKRTNFAIFKVLNTANTNGRLKLNHHWGSKKVKVRNIIIMINNKPKGEFDFVKVLLLKELNGYIKYLNEIYTEEEVNNIYMYLRRIQNRN
jgi:hypothetical protein